MARKYVYKWWHLCRICGEPEGQASAWNQLPLRERKARISEKEWRQDL